MKLVRVSAERNLLVGEQNLSQVQMTGQFANRIDSEARWCKHICWGLATYNMLVEDVDSRRHTLKDVTDLIFWHRCRA